MLSINATVVVDDENDIVSGKFLIFIQKLDHKQQKKIVTIESSISLCSRF